MGSRATTPFPLPEISKIAMRGYALGVFIAMEENVGAFIAVEGSI